MTEKLEKFNFIAKDNKVEFIIPDDFTKKEIAICLGVIAGVFSIQTINDTKKFKTIIEIADFVLKEKNTDIDAKKIKEKCYIELKGNTKRELKKELIELMNSVDYEFKDGKIGINADKNEKNEFCIMVSLIVTYLQFIFEHKLNPEEVNNTAIKILEKLGKK